MINSPKLEYSKLQLCNLLVLFLFTKRVSSYEFSYDLISTFLNGREGEKRHKCPLQLSEIKSSTEVVYQLSQE